jgi:hypothetical protein
MKQVLFISAIALICSLQACKEDKKSNSDKQNASLAGVWDNLYVRIETKTRNNTDSSEVFEVSGAEWQTKAKVKVIRTSLNADSTWNSAHYNLSDSIAYNPSGKWWVVGDSLVFHQLLPTQETNTYKFTLNGDTVIFESSLDWDQDGKKDDHYFGRQVRIKK